MRDTVASYTENSKQEIKTNSFKGRQLANKLNNFKIFMLYVSRNISIFLGIFADIPLISHHIASVKVTK